MTPSKETEMTEKVFLRMTPMLRASLEDAAARSGLVFSEWCRSVLARAAAEGAYAAKASRKRKGD